MIEWLRAPSPRRSLARIAGLPALCALLVPAAVGGSNFVDVTTGPLGDASATFGVAWGDFDNDGDYDLYVVNSAAPNRLLRNDGNDVFVDVTPVALADSGSGFSAAWGDYDNDGDQDLYLANDGPNRLFRNDGGGAFADVTTGNLGNPDPGQSVAWSDYDVDGDLDLYVTNFDADNLNFRNDGNLDFVPLAGILADSDDGTGLGWADYDNDGDLDLYVGAMQGGKRFRKVPGGFSDETTPLFDIVGVTGVAWGDYDNDADLDLYVSRDLSQNKLLRNDGKNNGFVEVVSSPLQDNGAGTGVAWADFDNDGDLDLFLGNSDSPNELFRNEGFGIFNEVGTPAMDNAGAVKGVAWADYDQDGDLDLFLAVTNGSNRLFRNDLVSNNHWLHMDLYNWAGNRSGVGTRVRLVAGGRTQIREVQAGSGLYSQNSLCVEFGLGSSTSLSLLEVRWPDGQVDSVSVAAVDQKLLVRRENRNPTAVGDPDPGARLRLAGRPNPFRTVTRIHYELTESSPVHLRILDVRGGLVRVLETGTVRHAGVHETRWDGRDDRGLRVAPGVYFSSLRASGSRAAARLILAP